MLTGEIRSQIDQIWNAFWSGGISNPMEVIEQITYLLFIKRLDDLQKAEESKANRLGKPLERPVFSKDQQDLRWSVFRHTDPKTMYETVDRKVFPFIKE